MALTNNAKTGVPIQFSIRIDDIVTHLKNRRR